MTQPQKKVITDTSNHFSPSDFEGMLTDARDRIRDLINDYGPSARLYFDRDFHYDYDSNPSPQFFIHFSRDETNEEFEKRVKEEEQKKAAIEAREFAEYQRLQKKFGSKGKK
jgi:hypothetical protein